MVLLPEHEAAVVKAVQGERGMWEEVIFRNAKRCGVSIRGLSPGEVIRKMADRILYKAGEARYCCLCDRRSLVQPLSDIPGVHPDDTIWLCSKHAKKLLAILSTYVHHSEDEIARSLF